MAKYTPDSYQSSVTFDELGLRLAMPRLPSEDLATYRNRLLLQGRVPPGASEDEYIKSVNRTVGVFEQRMFGIDLVLDSDDQPLASDPRIEIDSTFIRVWSDYENGTLDLELNIWEKGSGYYLYQVYDALDKLSFISVEALAEDYAYLRSWNMVYGNTDGHEYRKFVSTSNMTNLNQKYIRDILFDAVFIFENEVASPDNISVTGDFYIDKVNGIVWSEELGTATCTFSYRDFPYIVWWQPIKAVPLNDERIDYLMKDNLLEDTKGEEKRLLLKPYGAKIVNEILSVHPLQWGK